MSPRVLVVQHEDDDPIHRLGEWMAVDLDVRRPYLGDPLPASLVGYDALVVMGGVMGAHDDATCPWLTPVKELIREAATNGVLSLGICLGHQLTAVALGGEALPNPRGRQLGLYDVGWEPDAHLDELFAAVATPRRGAHWNDDIVTRLPEGARVLARSGGDIQAARFAPTVWGVQWHPEVDEPLFRSWFVDSSTLDPVLAEQAVGAVAAVGDQLAEWWRPLGVRFAELASAHVSGRT